MAAWWQSDGPQGQAGVRKVGDGHVVKAVHLLLALPGSACCRGL